MKNMKFPALAAMICGSMLMSLPLSAQEAETAVTQEVAQNADNASPAPTPETEMANEELPEIREIGEFGPWAVNCVDFEEETLCSVQQTVSFSNEEGGPVMEVMFNENEGQTALNVSVPIDVTVASGMSMILSEEDQAPVWRADFQSCFDNKCVAGGIVNKEALSLSDNPIIVFVTAGGQIVGVPFSTENLDEGFEAAQGEVRKVPQKKDNTVSEE